MNPPHIPTTLSGNPNNITDSLVLITGAFEHLGFRTLISALEAGHCVIAMVHHEEQVRRISSKPSIRPYRDQLTFAFVNGTTAPQTFERVMKGGVTHVIHNASTAAPPTPKAKKGDKQQTMTMAQRFYDPARKSTMTILESASKIPSVRRVVMTSSVFILKPSDIEFGAGPYDVKTSLPPETAEAVSEFEALTNSKIIAYETAVNFAKERKPSFDLVHVLPGLMQGASELHETAEEMEQGFNKATIDTALGKIIGMPKRTTQILQQDVARVHVLALDHKLVRNLDNLVVVANDGGGIPWDEMVETIKRCYPNEVEDGILRPTKGQQNSTKRYDARSTHQALGVGFSDAVCIVRSVMDQYLQLRGK